MGYRLFIFAGMTAIIALLAERVSALFSMRRLNRRSETTHCCAPLQRA